MQLRKLINNPSNSENGINIILSSYRVLQTIYINQNQRASELVVIFVYEYILIQHLLYI